MDSQPPNRPANEKPAASVQADQMLRTRGYAGKFAASVIAGLAFLAIRDLRDREGSQILVSFGLNSIGWTWFWLILGAFLTWWIAGRISFNFYFMRAVGRYKDPDPIDPLQAGVVDISVWSFLVSYMATLFLASLAPGMLGWLRPPVIVLVSMIGSWVLSAVFVARTVRAIYGSPTVLETISRHQCDMESIKGGRCENWAFRSRFRHRIEEKKEFCRWHCITLVTAKANRTTLWRASFKQMQAGVYLLVSFVSLWRFALDGDILWLAVSTFCLGAAIRYLFDSIIAPWHALSRLAIWAKLVATGLALEVVAGIAILFLVGRQPELINPIVAALGKASAWLLFGPAIVYMFTAFLVTVAVDALIRRIFFFTSSSFAPVVVLPTLLPIWHLLESALRQHWLFREWVGDQFWRAVIGGEVRTTWGLAFLTSWWLPFSMLRKRQKEYDSTVAAYVITLASLFGPALVALVSIMASRYLLYFSGVVGSVAFIATTVVLSLLLSLLLRRILISVDLSRSVAT